MSDNKNIIVEGIKAGKSKMVILTELLRADETLDLNTAGALYKEVGTGEKLLLTNEEKNELVSEVIAQYNTDEGFNRDEAVKVLAEKGAMTEAAAVSRLKAACKEAGVEFPVAVRAKRDMEAVKNAVKTWHEQGTTKEQILAGLIQHYDYTEKNAPAAYNKLGKEIGFIEGRVATGRIEQAAWFLNPANVKGTKAEIVERMMEAQGVTKATAETRYVIWQFAVEYHKQASEMEAANTKKSKAKSKAA
jgi:hypothetical protein